jgi:hypothetical protein
MVGARGRDGERALRDELPKHRELSEHPELATLRILKTTLEVAELVLAEVSPKRGQRERRCVRSEGEAYADALLQLIMPVVILLDEYVESLRGDDEWGRGESPERDDEMPSSDEIPF